MFETYRWLVRHVEDEDRIDLLAGSVDRHVQVPIDADLARRAAIYSVTMGLAAADAAIYAASMSRFATLLTFDRDFAGIDGVVVLDR